MKHVPLIRNNVTNLNFGCIQYITFNTLQIADVSIFLASLSYFTEIDKISPGTTRLVTLQKYLLKNITK